MYNGPSELSIRCCRWFVGKDALKWLNWQVPCFTKGGSFQGIWHARTFWRSWILVEGGPHLLWLLIGIPFSTNCSCYSLIIFSAHSHAARRRPRIETTHAGLLAKSPSHSSGVWEVWPWVFVRQCSLHAGFSGKVQGAQTVLVLMAWKQGALPREPFDARCCEFQPQRWFEHHLDGSFLPWDVAKTWLIGLV